MYSSPSRTCSTTTTTSAARPRARSAFRLRFVAAFKSYFRKELCRLSNDRWRPRLDHELIRGRGSGSRDPPDVVAVGRRKLVGNVAVVEPFHLIVDAPRLASQRSLRHRRQIEHPEFPLPSHSPWDPFFERDPGVVG